MTEFLRHPAVRATDGVHFNLGGKRPLIPLDLDGDAHRRYRGLLDPLFTPKRSPGWSRPSAPGPTP